MSQMSKHTNHYDSGGKHITTQLLQDGKKLILSVNTQPQIRCEITNENLKDYVQGDDISLQVLNRNIVYNQNIHYNSGMLGLGQKPLLDKTISSLLIKLTKPLNSSLKLPEIKLIQTKDILKPKQSRFNFQSYQHKLSKQEQKLRKVQQKSIQQKLKQRTTQTEVIWREKKKFKGKVDRVNVPNQFPFSASPMLIVWTKDKDRKIKFCSGTANFITNSLAMTAAHNLYTSKDQEIINIYLISYANGNKPQTIQIKKSIFRLHFKKLQQKLELKMQENSKSQVSSAQIPKLQENDDDQEQDQNQDKFLNQDKSQDQIDEQCTKYDIAYLQIKQQYIQFVNKYCGHYKLGTGKFQKSQYLKCLLYGYPSDLIRLFREKGITQYGYFAKNYLVNWKKQIIQYFMDTNPGQSGALGTFIRKDGAIIGRSVHKGGRIDNTKNIGKLITKKDIKFISYLMQMEIINHGLYYQRILGVTNIFDKKQGKRYIIYLNEQKLKGSVIRIHQTLFVYYKEEQTQIDKNQSKYTVKLQEQSYQIQKIYRIDDDDNSLYLLQIAKQRDNKDELQANLPLNFGLKYYQSSKSYQSQNIQVQYFITDEYDQEQSKIRFVPIKLKFNHQNSLQQQNHFMQYSIQNRHKSAERKYGNFVFKEQKIGQQAQYYVIGVHAYVNNQMNLGEGKYFLKKQWQPWTKKINKILLTTD